MALATQGTLQASDLTFKKSTFCNVPIGPSSAPSHAHLPRSLLPQSRKNVEGTLFVVKRRTLPRFQFVVLNRLSTENCRVDLLGEFEFELSPPYLLYRSSKEVNGIWFYRQEECDEMSALFTKITSAFSKQVTTPEEMTTDMILQSMGIGGAGAEVASAQEPEPQQYESNSVTALFKAASLGQESGQSPATNDAELDLEPVTAPKREKKQREPKEPKAEPSGGGLNRESVRAAMYKLVSNDNFIDLIVKELKRAM